MAPRLAKTYEGTDMSRGSDGNVAMALQNKNKLSVQPDRTTLATVSRPTHFKSSVALSENKTMFVDYNNN